MNDVRKTKHSAYQINYPIVFYPKFRHNALSTPIQNELKAIFVQIANEYEFEILALETMPEHVHLFVSAKPMVAPTTIVKSLKSISTVKVFHAFPTLKKRYFWGTGLWSRGYYVSTAGVVSSETIKRYIAMQKQK